MPDRLVIIDAHAIVHRAFHALPPFTTKDGKLVNALYGFLSILFKIIKELAPTHLAVAFDTKEPTFRHEAFTQYKAQRKKKPEDLYAQLPLIKEALDALGIQRFELKGFEADDIIATLVEKLAHGKEQPEVIIATGDLDALQLVRERVTVYAFKRGISDTVTYDEAAVRKRFGFDPSYIIDFKALAGDVSDNIPGVKGIGEKTAMTLVAEYGTVQKLYRALESKKINVSPALRSRLIAGKDAALRSKELVTLVRDVPIPFSLDGARIKAYDRERVVELLRQWEFTSLVARLPGDTTAPQETHHPTAEGNGRVCIVANEKNNTRLRKALELSARFSLYLAPEPADLFGSGGIAAVGVATDAGAFGGDPKRILETCAPFLENTEKTKIIFDAKSFMHVCNALHPPCTPTLPLLDPMLAAYLLRPGEREIVLNDLILTVLGREVRQGKSTAADAAEMARLLIHLSDTLDATLKEKAQWDLYTAVELPLIPVLYRMEHAGITIDVPLLNSLSDETAKKLELLTKDIHRDAGREFNIHSSQQLKTVLFDELRIPTTGIRKGKTGLSTAAPELEKLRGLHPIVDLIFTHRELSKLKSTYLDALPTLVDADGRVHTTFNQAITATGRLSSSDPNVQNIPVRTAFGRRIREAFIAAEGYTLLSADYSQLELRIVSHLANDATMIDIFRNGGDIHTATAAKLNGVSESAVSPAMRRAAKAVNFGIIYGMGPQGLAASTKMTVEEAKEFIAKYFAAFRGVAQYIAETKALAASLGYVETLYGRRRYLPEIHSGMPQVRAAAERMAVNMPVQGTNADMIKKAMIALDAANGIRHTAHRTSHGDVPAMHDALVRMLLQVHDELLFEVKEALVHDVAQKVKMLMENVVKLRVPVVVEMRAGKRWGRMEKLVRND